MLLVIDFAFAILFSGFACGVIFLLASRVYFSFYRNYFKDWTMIHSRLAVLSVLIYLIAVFILKVHLPFPNE